MHDWATDIQTYSNYAAVWPYAGFLTYQEVFQYQQIGGVWAPRQLSATSSTVNSQATLRPGGLYTHFPHTVSATTTRRDLNGAFVSRSFTSNTFDTLGNLTQADVVSQTESGAADGFRTTTFNEYVAPDHANHVIGQLKCTAVQSTTPAGSATRTSSFTYNGTARLLYNEVIEPGVTCQGAPAASTDPALRVITWYAQRDVYGNVTEKSVQSGVSSGQPGYFTPRIVTLDHLLSGNAGRGRFALLESNAAGHRTYRVFDPGSGLLLSEEVAKPTANPAANDGLKTSMVYSPLGRLKSVTRPDGVTTSYGYTRCDATNCGGSYWEGRGYWITSVTPGVPGTMTIFDQLDRTLQARVGGFDGAGWDIRESYEYNVLGKLAYSHNPFKDGTTPTASTAVAYDAFARPVHTWDQSSTPDSRGYDGRVSTVTDRRGVTSRVTVDAWGRISESLQAVSTPRQSGLTFDHDPHGNIRTVQASTGTVRTATFDLRGRRLTVSDPDTGAYTYTYDALGHLRTQTDANGKTTTLTYDQLGRLKTRTTTDDESSTFEYDRTETECAAGGKVTGQRTRTQTASGTVSWSCFDSAGRLSATARSVVPPLASGQVAMSQTFSYDGPTGRLTGTSYSPAGIGLSYLYSTSGYQDRVVAANNPNRLHWQALAIDAAGRVTQERLGRLEGDGLRPGSVITRGFGARHTLDSVAGRQQGASADFAYQSFAFDANLNLTYRGWWDGANWTEETTAYDELNRLTTLTRGSTVKTFGYDLSGNLTAKDGLTYSYPSATSPRPSAVTGIAGTLNGVSNPSYQYDATGNLLKECIAGNCANPSRTLTWLNSGYPSQIQKGTTTLNFWYDADRQRRWQRVQSGGTVTETSQYGPGGWERRIAGGTTTDVVYLQAGGRAVGMLRSVSSTASQQYLISDHLGSPFNTLDEQSQPIEREGFDAWGRRRNANGTDNPAITALDRRGFTMHEHLDSVGLVHMNGRVYDPALGRFVSADPLVQFAGNLQSYNRYSYVLNNPLTLTDPSGFSSWTDFRDGILKPAVAVAAAYFTGMYVSNYFLVGASNAYIATGATSTTFAAIGAEAGTLTMAGTATTGAAGGFAGGLVASGGDLRVAGRAAATGALFGVVGNIGYTQGWGTAEYVFAHSAVGCVSGALSSEGCGPGALSAGFGKYVTLSSEGMGAFAQGVAAATAGGVGSWAGGGRFAQGAGTAALGYLFNHCAHNGCWVTDEERQLFAAGKVREGYALSCMNGDGYACSALRVVDETGAMETLTNIRLETSLINNGVVRSRYEAIPIMDAIKVDLGKAYVDYLDGLGASPSNPQWPTRAGIGNFHDQVFQNYGAGKVFGGRISDALIPRSWFDWCSTCKK